jgi:hypothetical protein
VAIDGRLYIGEGETPNVARFSLDEDGRPVADGTMSFLDFGMSAAGLFSNHFASATRAYMAVDAETRAIWNPSSLELVGELVLDLPEPPAGTYLYASYDRGSVNRDERVYQPIYPTDDDFYLFPQRSHIVGWNADDGSDVTVVDADCPMLDIGFADDAGNLWFSNWVHAVGAPVFSPGQGAAPCVVKIPAGSETIDEDFPGDLSTLTDGRQVAALRYVGGSLAVAAVFHDDELTEAERADPASLYTNHWYLWTFDLETLDAAPIDGLDAFGGGYYAFRLDGRLVLLLPTDDYSRTFGYEVLPDGSVEQRFVVDGWVLQMSALD